jgi:hypothetical protein
MKKLIATLAVSENLDMSDTCAHIVVELDIDLIQKAREIIKSTEFKFLGFDSKCAEVEHELDHVQYCFDQDTVYDEECEENEFEMVKELQQQFDLTSVKLTEECRIYVYDDSIAIEYFRTDDTLQVNLDCF